MTSAPFTAIPNWLIEAMPQMPGSVFQVAVVIARQTVGYSDGNGGRKEWDRISLTQFEAATGLSRQGVLNALDAGLGRWFERREVGQWFEYKLVNLVDQLDQSNQLTSQLSRPVVVNSVDQLGAKLVNSVDTQKKESLKKSINKTEADDDEEKGAPDPATATVFAAWQENIPGTLTPILVDKLHELTSECGPDAVIHGITASVQAGARNFNYIAKCARNHAAGADPARALVPAARNNGRPLSKADQTMANFEEYRRLKAAGGV